MFKYTFPGHICDINFLKNSGYVIVHLINDMMRVVSFEYEQNNAVCLQTFSRIT